jgi:hypothetical protein
MDFCVLGKMLYRWWLLKINKNKNMKKISLSLIVLFSIFLPLFFVMGQQPPYTMDETTNVMGFFNILKTIANWLFSFLVVVGVIGAVISGYMFVTSGGDPGKANSAGKMLIYSLVGVLIGSLGWVLVNFVLNI